MQQRAVSVASEHVTPAVAPELGQAPTHPHISLAYIPFTVALRS